MSIGRRLSAVRRQRIKTCSTTDRWKLRRSVGDVEAALLQLLLTAVLAAVFLHHAAVEEVDGAISVTRVTRIVRHHADRRSLTMELAKQFHDSFTVLRIEVSRWLVGEQNRR